MAISIRVVGAAFTKIISVILKTVRFSSIGAFTQTLVSGQYVYTGASATYANTSVLKLPSSTDGYMRAKIQATGSAIVILCAKNTNAGIKFDEASTLFGIYTSVGNNYSVLQAGAIVTPSGATLPYASDDIMQLRRNSGNWVAEVSKDGGKTFVIVHTFASTSTVEIFPFIQQNFAGTSKFTVTASPLFAAA